jgi:hypothetical protein
MKPAFRSLKLDDVKELQDLVADSVEAVEPGLRLVDSRVLLGGATIDLLALDARGALTLVAVGFQADDEMLLRALEAYSWCLEYPDALQRLYPNVKPAASESPRVIFIAERAPDAFLRKIKHLKFRRADCLEFRFGLQFELVEEMRGTEQRRAPESNSRAPRPEPEPAARPPRQEPAPAQRPARSEPGPAARPARVEAPAPRPEPVVAHASPPPRVAVAQEAAHAGAEEHDEVLEQLRAASATATAWRPAATKSAGDVDEEKVRSVREYLQKEFPTAVIYDFYAHDRGVQMFHLQDSHGALIHSAAVSEDLLDETAETQLRAFLDKHKLARVLRQAGSAGVSVTKSGLKIERR